MPQLPSRRVAIVGGSMGGLFAALLLKSRGWAIDIYERNPTELAGRGAGIVTHAALFDALREAGVPVADDLGVPVNGRRTYARDGSVIGSLDFPQTNTSWDRLFQLLRAAVPEGRYHLDKSLTGIAQDEDSVTITFADGSTATADLLIGADGFRSTVRAALLPDVAPIYAGYVAWRGLVDEADLSPKTREQLFDGFTFCLPPGEQMLGYPVAGPDNDLRPGHRRFNFVWYRPASAQTGLPRLLTDDSGKTYDVSIPPPLIAKVVIDDMRGASDTTLAPVFAEAVRKTAMPFFQPIYDLTVPKMVFGRVVILGDAAFVARPHVGAGVTKAAEDALVLANALAADPDQVAALRSFETQRLAIGHRIIARARHLGAYMQAQLKTPEEQEAAERHRSPDAVMRETASIAFLSETVPA
jgi:2-polyprenyl-6-methoxyphenol hydroxylase-like FAD-dependent oxidoreductase